MAKKKKKKAAKAKNTRRRWAWIAAAALVAVCVAAWLGSRYTQSYSGEKDAWVYIPEGASASAVRDSITSSLGPEFGGRVATLVSGNPTEAHGAYRVAPGDKAWRVARRISQGRQSAVKLTFNNVRTFAQLADRLASRMEFTPDDFLNAADSLAREQGLTTREFEAQFLPDTYEAYWTASPASVIEKIQANYRRFWTDERRAQASAEGLTPLQASIVASIVEEESNRTDEHGLIARLYLNRLHKGMRLQADPTVRFALGDFTIRRVAGPMLSVASPYNTYRVDGLPPGVIRLPAAATIDRVLSAPRHPNLYMCARTDGSGRHDFAATYDAHLANARAYRSHLDSRGIK